MLETLADMDRLLACNRTFSLKDWNEEARTWGETPEEKDYYEENARTIISYWGGAGILTDYAARQWSGMVSSYYGYRWQQFVDKAIEDVEKGIPFCQESFDRSMRTFELEWARPAYSISYPEAGDPVSTGKSIARKMGIL
jgi:alpha-N-acetylglucosaminidase